ncbi:hypothetical protein OMCYN_01619 [cyanobiont of Ornithocercus magnificus]|nr:hypothetical protein OMCYN_01619 [cyanobiont of Ornithocercus magnificus]
MPPDGHQRAGRISVLATVLARQALSKAIGEEVSEEQYRQIKKKGLTLEVFLGACGEDPDYQFCYFAEGLGVHSVVECADVDAWIPVDQAVPM